MLVVEHLDGYIIDKPKKATELLKLFEPMALQLNEGGYYLCYSGGKDSDTIIDLALEAGVKFTAHYNVTGIDPKEAITHIKETRTMLKAVGIELQMNSPNKFTTGPFKGLYKNMWRLIVHKMMPPTRCKRFCCSELKEHGGKGCLCLTGVRWDESAARKNNRKALEIMTSKKKNKKLFNDNDEGRMQFENCLQKGKRIINPIVDWLTYDVWDYINLRRRGYCVLYNQGFDRIGCIGCPMGGGAGMEKDFERYPYIKKMYIKAYDEMIEYRKARGLYQSKNWTSGEAVLEWQMWADDKEQEKIIENQMDLFQWAGIDIDEYQ